MSTNRPPRRILALLPAGFGEALPVSMLLGGKNLPAADDRFKPSESVQAL